MDLKSQEKLKLSIILRKLWVYLKGYRLGVLSLFGITVLSLLCNLYTVIYTKKLVDMTVNNQSLHIGLELLIIVLIIAVGSICSYLCSYLRGKLGVCIVRQIRRKAIEHIENTKIQALEGKTAGDIVSRINEDSSTIENIIMYDLSNYIYFPLMILASGIYMAIMSFQLFIITYITIPIVLVIINFLGASLNRRSKTYSDELADTNSLFFEMIHGIQTIKANNAQEFIAKRYQDKLHVAFKTGMECERLRVLNYSSIINIIRILPYVMCIVFGGKMVFDKKIQIGVIVAYTQLLDYTINPSIMLSQLITNMRSAVGSIARVLEVMDLPLEDSFAQEHIDLKQKPVQFSNVSFSYGNDKTIIHNLSFSLNQNSNLTFVGSSGCGKSTIIKLICKFYTADSGTIKIFGKDIKNLDVKELREKIAMVSQDSYLFADTIANNIAYGKENVTKQEIIEAAKKAGAHEFITLLPEGYETNVGELGGKLSGGQKQRISIARAFIKDAPILLLDEPTSALDYHAESMLQEVLDTLACGKSVIKITHNLNTINDNDMIFVVEEGKIVQEGLHKQLVQEAGRYKTLYDNQNSEEVAD